MRLGANRIPVLVLVASLLVAGSSCSFAKGKEIAETGVRHFHDQYNSEQFHEIYVQADDGFKQAVTEAEFTELLEAVHRKLGTVKESKPAGWGVNATPTGTIATLSYEVEFSDGKGVEEFVFHVSGDKALLYHYNINSPTLITK
jgi:hypothetical protein